MVRVTGNSVNTTDMTGGMTGGIMPVGAFAQRALARPLDWRRRMSDNIAYALLVYTTLQIFVTMTALETTGSALLPYLALVVLVGAIIPACRGVERRWDRLSDAQAADPRLARRFRRDQRLLWTLAVGLPFAFTGAFLGLSALFA